MLCLYNLCLQRTADLIKSHYWDTDSPFGCNPFCLMPSAIVDALILYLARLSVHTSEYLESSDLHLLLTSGQVREFVLEDIDVSAEHLRNILTDLASACRKVINIKIGDVSCIKDKMKFHMENKHALSLLLSEAHNVRYVESCIEFDLNALCRSYRLEKLVLNFSVKDHLFDFLKVNGQLMPNHALKCLEVFQDPRHKVKYEDIALILRYCPELREINCDISKSLEYLHAEELLNGTLSTKYKLEKCNLGCDYVGGKEAVVSRDGVIIASLTCPQLRAINMLVRDDQAIHALSDFKNLKNLVIQWEEMGFGFGDYTSGVQLLLEKPEFGQNLACLNISHYTNVDFASIGACCPNLTELKVEYEYGSNQNEFSPESFKKLKFLFLESIDDHNIETLFGLLSNATDLIIMAVLDEGRLTDEVLNSILKKNKFSKLQYLSVFKCVLSLDGIRTLVSSCKALQHFCIGEPVDNSDEIVSVIYEINPLLKVDVRTAFLYHYY